jgi:hypothetical protein
MTDRLGAIGGVLRVESAPGSGTAVRGEIPIPGEQPATASRTPAGGGHDATLRTPEGGGAASRSTVGNGNGAASRVPAAGDGDE